MCVVSILGLSGVFSIASVTDLTIASSAPSLIERLLMVAEDFEKSASKVILFALSAIACIFADMSVNDFSLISAFKEIVFPFSSSASFC